MKLSDIQEAVVQLWNLILPPVINLTVLTLTTYFVTPALFLSITSHIPLIDPAILNDPTLQKLLDFYGINKLAPFLLIFLLIFALYVLQILVSSLASILPGALTVVPARLTFQIAGSERLTRIWSMYPDVDDLSILMKILGKRLNALSWTFSMND
jgi:hypothetical protein